MHAIINSEWLQLNFSFKAKMEMPVILIIYYYKYPIVYNKLKSIVREQA